MFKEEYRKKAMLIFMPQFEIFCEFNRSEPISIPSYWIGRVILLSFTCEIGLKAITVYEGKKFLRIHKLDELFTCLSPSTKNILYAKTTYPRDEFLKQIKENNNHFEKWRYYFDGCESANIQFLEMLLGSIAEILLPPEYLKQLFPKLSI